MLQCIFCVTALSRAHTPCKQLSTLHRCSVRCGANNESDVHVAHFYSLIKHRKQQIILDLLFTVPPLPLVARVSDRSHRLASTHDDHCHSTLLVVCCPQQNQDEHHMDKEISGRQPRIQKNTGWWAGWGWREVDVQKSTVHGD